MSAIAIAFTGPALVATGARCGVAGVRMQAPDLRSWGGESQEGSSIT